MHNYRELGVWKKAHRLTLLVYEVTESFPSTELYGLTVQMRRSAASIGMNIAEGCAKTSNLDFSRFLEVALGSAKELDYQILLSRDLELTSSQVNQDLVRHVTEVQRMLTGLIRHVRPAET